MKNYHCCATCIHYEIRKATLEKYYCSRLGYATNPKHQFKCWTPKDNIRIKELRELSVNDGSDVYQMMIEIGLGDNSFANSFPTNSLEAFIKSLPRFVEVANGINLSDGNVPQTIYWLYVNNKPVAYGELRHHLNEKLREFGGHVGYMVRPSERGKGYGKVILSELLKAAKDKKISEVFITCDDDNQPSRRVIEANNGQLTEMKNGICKYWIKH